MFVQDVIDLSEVIKWQAKDNVLVKAPTGSGKSYFILNILARYYENVNKKILIFSNRNLLKEQNKKNAHQNIECFNYQQFEKMSSNQIKKELSDFDVICFDECHYFFADSSFNLDTKKILDYALKKTNQIKIFASATPEPIYKTGIKFDFRYNVEENFEFIKNVVFYRDINDVLPKIAKDKAKSICFFGNSLEAVKFKTNNKDIVSFICSKSNKFYDWCDKEEVDSIIEKNCFSRKILATTTVLDNGVSVIDSNLKNVLIDLTDPVTIIQSLGRKRIVGKEKITLYMRLPFSGELNIDESLAEQSTPRRLL